MARTARTHQIVGLLGTCLALGCAPEDGSTSTGSGGNPSTGGSRTTGGTASTSGGKAATGGASTTGGAATGGKATGGVTSSGGKATGGATSTGNVSTSCPGAVPAGITTSYCACGIQDKTTSSGFTIYNNVWGSGAGPQCLWATTTTQWGVAANHPNTGGVKSYPNISVSPKTTISAIKSYTSSFDVTVPTGGSWEVAYDIWVKGTTSARIEIMLWMYKTGSVAPIKSVTGPSVTVGGHSWTVYYGSNGSNDVVSFVRSSNTTSGTVDVKAILDWIIANNTSQYGRFTNSYTLDQVQFGFEITSDGSVQEFVNNSFSVSSS
jgi:hypothetical protein